MAVIYCGSKSVTKDDFLSLLNNHDVYLKTNSVKLEHYVNGIVISNNHPTKGTTVFHKNEGFPIKLDIESFLILSIECRHKVIDELKIPIESTIEWKIVNGVEDGVFKHGHGLETRYSDSDNNDSVIYYPPRHGIGKNQNVKEIPIALKIETNKKNRKPIKNLPLGSTIGVTDIGLCDYDDCSLLLTLYLKQSEGFMNKMLYEISFSLKKTTKESKLENHPNPNIKTSKNDSNSDFIYSYLIGDNEEIPIFKKNVPKCTYCDPVMTFKAEYKSHPTEHKPKINIKTDRFFTSEYIKISNNHTYNKNTHSTNQCSFLSNTKNSRKHICKFRIMNCPPSRLLNFFGPVLQAPFLVEILASLLYITRQKRRNYLNLQLFCHYMNRAYLLVQSMIHRIFWTKKRFGFYEELPWVVEIKNIPQLMHQCKK